MNWNNFLTYGDSPQNAFETLCNHLFEKYLRRHYKNKLGKFRIINGAGGDGGIEAYGELSSGEIIAIQTKWFRDVLDTSEITQISKSVITAKDLRPKIKEYIICIPRNVNSLKYGRGANGKGKKTIDNYEEKRIDEFVTKITAKYPDLKITWWFEKDIELELQHINNEGVHRYWFDKEIISIDFLINQFNLNKKGWLNERYVPELHSQGIIHKEYHKLCFSKEWRTELYNQTQDVLDELHQGVFLTEQFISTNIQFQELNIRLKPILNNLKLFYTELEKLRNEIIIGNEHYEAKKNEEVKLLEVTSKLRQITPTNIQKDVLPKLIKTLDNIHTFFLPEYIEDINLKFNQGIRLILGEPGTGKTHGLANCVETHLQNNSPALIIQAKGCSCKNWTEILSETLELASWNKKEIFSALETLAIRNDVFKAKEHDAGIETNIEASKVLICIDGLEEDVVNKKEWYARIREAVQLTEDYPRIKFIFSARSYFYNNREVPNSNLFDSINLPREGDVRILEVAEKYFNKKHFNIQLSSYSLIKGIDSLFALRLFCEQYRNTKITEKDKITTATKGLLNIKIKRINQEFINNNFENKKSSTRNPILDSLKVISDYFYSNLEIEHNKLNEIILLKTNGYLNISEIDLLIDYLVDNGFIIRSEKIKSDDILNEVEHIYNITYQSIIEHVLSETILQRIKNKEIESIPDILHQGLVQPLDFEHRSIMNIAPQPNQRIIQNIVNELFIDKGLLIGENGFLDEGFDEEEIFKMQMEALIIAPKEIAKKYKVKVDKMFFGGFRKQFRILKYLIIPSSNTNNSSFGAEYLHSVLINQVSVFERDRLWSGLDNYEKKDLSSDESIYYNYEEKTFVFSEGGFGKLFLSEYHTHNQLPLIYAWGLSTIDQRLRDKFRIALTEWAINQPNEFVLLLDKIFKCNDPQIQEDLASIMLGLASKLKNKEEIKNLALWSIENIFSHTDKYRNIVVRQGFRSIVERAYQFNLISKTEVDKSRPKVKQLIKLLPYDNDLIINERGECYPIVHDLAWYVIKKAYDDFLELPSSFAKETKDNDCKEAKILLDEYRSYIGDYDLFAFRWTLSVAIAYIKNLGFSRIKGNYFTDATHGGKSQIFTYEEKYTWLAVHYIQGYLSDYIPIKNPSGTREFIKDYSQITDIPNPSEAIIDLNKQIDNFNDNIDWVIKENLINELDTNISIKESIKKCVNEEPNLDFNKWLIFDSVDINIKTKKQKWIALYNHTSLHDSKKLCYSYIDTKALIIKKNDLPIIQKIIDNNPDQLFFIKHLDSLISSPQTDIYSNPSDIVWMTWVEEIETKQTAYNSETNKEFELFHTITKVVKNSVDGEKHYKIPSKKVRNLIKANELQNNEVKNTKQETVALYTKNRDDSSRDNQEIVLVNQEILTKALEKYELEIIWFVELFRQKNPSNKALDKDFQEQKAFKYFCWLENGIVKEKKFWNEIFSNQRDK